MIDGRALNLAYDNIKNDIAFLKNKVFWYCVLAATLVFWLYLMFQKTIDLIRGDTSLTDYLYAFPQTLCASIGGLLAGLGWPIPIVIGVLFALYVEALRFQKISKKLSMMSKVIGSVFGLLSFIILGICVGFLFDFSGYETWSD